VLTVYSKSVSSGFALGVTWVALGVTWVALGCVYNVTTDGFQKGWQHKNKH